MCLPNNIDVGDYQALILYHFRKTFLFLTSGDAIHSVQILLVTWIEQTPIDLGERHRFLVLRMIVSLLITLFLDQPLGAIGFTATYWELQIRRKSASY